MSTPEPSLSPKTFDPRNPAPAWHARRALPGGLPGGDDPGPRRRASGLFVCGACFSVRGESAGRRQLCRCASAEEHEALEEETLARDGTRWTYIVGLCRCCGAEGLNASHKFTHWFCYSCYNRVAGLNRLYRSCVIAVGAHSIVNGVFFAVPKKPGVITFTPIADQIGAFFRESGGVWERGRAVIERHWRAAGLPVGAPVPLEDYLTAVQALHVDKWQLFSELASACGVPEDVLSPSSPAPSFVWSWPDPDSFEVVVPLAGEDEREDGKRASARLRIRNKDGSWHWRVTLERRGSRRAGLLAAGKAPTVGGARIQCETAAVAATSAARADAGR